MGDRSRMVSNIMGSVKDEYKTWIFNVFIKWIFGIAVFGLLISENLTNIMDGIWTGPYMFGGDWETSIGRWFIRYIDKLRFGIAINPFISIVALLVYSIGTEMMAGVFEIKKIALNYFVSFLFISNTIVCVTLSHTYMAVVFAVCFMLAVLAVLFLKLTVRGAERKTSCCFISG